MAQRNTHALTDSDINTLEIVEDNTEAVIEALGEAIGRALEEVGLVAEGYAKKLAPVDTGRLRNSITHSIDPDDLMAYIGTNVEYAKHQELGTSKMQAANGGRGYLRPAANDHASKYRAIIEKHLKNA